MDLTERQLALFRALGSSVEGKAHRRIEYHSEYLGYLPFGQYHWITVNGVDITSELPQDFSAADLDALSQSGLLTKVESWRNPKDESEVRMVFEVSGFSNGPYSED